MSSSSGNVFLAPCDFADFDATVATPVSFEEDEDVPDTLADLGTARVWTVPEGDQNRSNFEKLETGDLLLFYDGDTFVGTGRVGETLEDDWATTRWEGVETGLIFTVEDFEDVSVPRGAVNRIFEYSESWNPGGLMRVAEDRVTNEPAAIKLAVERYGE